MGFKFFVKFLLGGEICSASQEGEKKVAPWGRSLLYAHTDDQQFD